MLNSFKPDNTYIACGYTDLRRGIDSLAEIVHEHYKLDPLYTAASSTFFYSTRTALSQSQEGPTHQKRSTILLSIVLTIVLYIQ